MAEDTDRGVSTYLQHQTLKLSMEVGVRWQNTINIAICRHKEREASERLKYHQVMPGVIQ